MNRKSFHSSRGSVSYIDEGQGDVILAIHGTPTSSIIYEQLLEPFKNQFRLIIPDLLGFGQSDQPVAWDASVEDHISVLTEFIAHLRLEKAHLMIHDFGGPIGIGAVQQSDLQLYSVTIFNSWCWQTTGTPADTLGKLLGGSFGKYLYVNLGVSSNVLLPSLFSTKESLTKDLRTQLTAPFVKKDARYVLWGLAKSLHSSNPVYEQLESFLKTFDDVPVLIVWGEKDKAFTNAQLERWKSHFPKAIVCQIPNAGHFPMIEGRTESGEAIDAFLRAFGES